MSSVPAPVRRHALGLPAGSVRALHVLGIVGLVCAIILIPSKDPANPVPIPPYLVYLLFLMLGHYFAAHGVTIANRDDPSPSPLYLPGGLVRLLIVAALTGCMGWNLYQDEPGLRRLYDVSVVAFANQPMLPLVILGSFFLGVLVRALVGRVNPPAVWQDLEAWISLMALLILAVAALIHLGIAPSMPALEMPTWEGFVGGVIAF